MHEVRGNRKAWSLPQSRNTCKLIPYKFISMFSDEYNMSKGEIHMKKILSFMPFVLIVMAIIATSVDSVKLVRQTDASVSDGVFVPVVMYHSILDNSSRTGDYVIDRKIFEDDMNYLIENGYTTVFISDLVNYVEGNGVLPEKPVAVTFDDGFYNTMYYAYPFMRDHNLKGTVNVVGEYSRLSTEENNQNPNFSSLTWDEISELNNSGVFEIGNHTNNMHCLGKRRGCKRINGESEKEYCENLYDDIGTLQATLQDNCGVTPVTFAYPYGFVSDESIDVLCEIGFKALLTCNEKPNYISRSNPECLKCINRYNRPSGISTDAFMKKLLSKN